MSGLAGVSPKVIAAAVGAGAGGVVSTLTLWTIGVIAYDVPATAEAVNQAVAAVPSPIAGGIALLLVVAGAAIPGYQVTDPARERTAVSETTADYDTEQVEPEHAA